MFVAKKEVTKIPFGRDIIRAGQTILVDRTSKRSSELAKEAINSRAHHKVEKGSEKPEWPTLVMFPESTCTNGTCLITFKQGAFMPGVPVQPITIKYHYTTADPCKVYGGGEIMTNPFPHILLSLSRCNFLFSLTLHSTIPPVALVCEQ